MRNPLAAPMSHPYDISDQHPSLYAAIEELMIYERWVSEVVLRIAFRWIDENKDKVYNGIPYELKDDIGVVINAAFNAVMNETPIEGDKQVRAFNPTWVEITKALQKARNDVFADQGQRVKDTSCVPTVEIEEQIPA
jgi:hypothetical protein